MNKPPLNSLIAVARAPKESLSRKLVGSSKIIIWGRFHRPAPRTTFTFCPPDKAPIRVCWANAGSKPKPSKCFWISPVVSFL
mmetsp:Transcript_23192/g.22341  ORF Transcript_23192/g.22341 Transcript_23192/m.22341 type:complete len:82 (-) Transcript_23192:2562-2807(-)